MKDDGEGRGKAQELTREIRVEYVLRENKMHEGENKM